MQIYIVQVNKSTDHKVRNVQAEVDDFINFVGFVQSVRASFSYIPCNPHDIADGKRNSSQNTCSGFEKDQEIKANKGIFRFAQS